MKSVLHQGKGKSQTLSDEFDIQRDVKLSSVRYFNQRLLNYTQLFASEADYIFYALPVTQQLKLSSQINIASNKFCSDHMTAGMLPSNFKETVMSFLTKDDGCQIMGNVKGTLLIGKSICLKF